MNFSKIKLQIIKEQSFSYNSKIIKSPLDITKMINDIEELDKLPNESIILICLNNRNNVIAYSQVAKGGINYCNLDFKTIFQNVLMCNCNKFILVHNHPSELIEPSSKDLAMTNQLKLASNLLGINFLDHLIIAGDDFVSCMVRN